MRVIGLANKGDLVSEQTHPYHNNLQNHYLDRAISNGASSSVASPAIASGGSHNLPLYTSNNNSGQYRHPSRQRDSKRGTVQTVHGGFNLHRQQAFDEDYAAGSIIKDFIGSGDDDTYNPSTNHDDEHDLVTATTSSTTPTNGPQQQYHLTPSTVDNHSNRVISNTDFVGATARVRSPKRGKKNAVPDKSARPRNPSRVKIRPSASPALTPEQQKVNKPEQLVSNEGRRPTRKGTPKTASAKKEPGSTATKNSDGNNENYGRLNCDYENYFNNDVDNEYSEETGAGDIFRTEKKRSHYATLLKTKRAGSATAADLVAAKDAAALQNNDNMDYGGIASPNVDHPPGASVTTSSSTGDFMDQRNEIANIQNELLRTQTLSDVTSDFKFEERQRQPEDNGMTQQSKQGVDQSKSKEQPPENPDNKEFSPNQQSTSSKPRITKTEKIKQLQAENEKCREEFKRIYKDRKELKKAMEIKQKQVSDLQKEVDAFVSETALLKDLLEESSRKVDQKEEDHKKGKDSQSKLEKDLQQCKSELKQAVSRIAIRKKEVERMEEIIKRKDAQISTLTTEVTNQIDQVQYLQGQLSISTNMPDGSIAVASANDGKSNMAKNGIKGLVEENDLVKAELGKTIERTAQMIKEAEDKISTLQRENEELKQLLDIRGVQKQDNKAEEEARNPITNIVREKDEAIQQLRDGIDKWEKEKTDLENELKRVQNLVKQKEDEIQDAIKEVDYLKKNQSQSDDEVHRLNDLVDQKEGIIANLLKDFDGLKQHIRHQHEEPQTDYSSKELERTIDMIKEREKTIERLVKENEQSKQCVESSISELDHARELLQLKEEQVNEVTKENNSVKDQISQMKSELQQSQDMIKEREDAIDDLLKEVEHFKHGEIVTGKEITRLTDLVNEREIAIADLIRECDGLKEKLAQEEQQRQRQQSSQDDEVTKPQSATMQSVKEKEDTIENMSKELKSSKQKLYTFVNELDRVKSALKTKEEQIANLDKENDEIKTRLLDTESRLERTEGMVRDREAVIEELSDEIAELKEGEGEIGGEIKQLKCALEDREESIAILKNEISGLKGDLIKSKKELDNAVLVAKEKEDAVRRLQEQVEVGEEQLKASTEELEHAMEILKRKDDHISNLMQKKEDLEEQNEILQADKQVGDRCTEVSEDDARVAEERLFLGQQVAELKEQAEALMEELGEMHRQNAILSEEVEEWLARGSDMENMIEELRHEVENWKKRAIEAEKNAQKAGTAENSSGLGRSEKQNEAEAQSMFLQQAIANQAKKQTVGAAAPPINRGTSFVARGFGGFASFVLGDEPVANPIQNEEGTESNASEKRIQELEETNARQEQEIKSLKSELITLNTTYKDEMYVSKKRVRQLANENDEYQRKIEDLENKLREMQHQ